MTKRERALKLAKKTKRVVYFGTCGHMGMTKNGKVRWDKGRHIYKIYPNGKTVLLAENVYFYEIPKNVLYIKNSYYNSL